MNIPLRPYRHYCPFALRFLLLVAIMIASAAGLHAQRECTPPPAGMVGWWSLDELPIIPGSIVADLTGNPNSYLPATAQNNGFVAGGVSATTGRVQGGFHFNGDGSQYVRVPHHAELNVGRGDFSIDAWVRLDHSASFGVIADKRDPVRNVRGYSLFVYGDHPGVQLADDSSGWYNYVAYGTTMIPGRWYMIAVTVDRDSPTGGKLWLDGQVVLTFDPRNRSGSLDNNGDFYIGTSTIYAASPFTGTIDEVELFRRALDPKEIDRIYMAGASGKCKVVQPQPPIDSGRCTPAPGGMIAWWSLDETGLSSGARVADLTGNPANYLPANTANTGFVVGGVTAVAGEVQGGFHFNGDGSQYVRVPNHPDLNVGRGDFSIDAWVKMDRTGYNMVVADKRDPVRNVRGYSLFIYGDHPGVQLADDSSGWYNFVAYGTTMAPGRWYMLAVTVDRDSPTGGKLWLNGQVVLTFDPRVRPGSLDNNGDFYIGTSMIYAASPFAGSIDEVELFKRVLDSQEVRRIYAAGSSGKCKTPTQQPPIDSGRCTPPPASLVGWWSNDEQRVAPGSSIEDLTGNPLKFSPANAMNAGTVSGNVTSVAGKVAGALHFGGGANDYVRVTNRAELDMDSNDLSIDAWIKLDEPGSNMIIVDKRHNPRGNQVVGYSFYVWGGSNLGFQMGDAGGVWSSFGTTTNSLQVGRWHFVAVTVNRRQANGGRLYVDGRIVSTFDPRVRPGSLANASDFYIGKSDIWSCRPFHGSIDEVEVFRRSLDSQEVSRIYAAGSAGKCKTPAQQPSGSCDSLWGAGHAEECCSYSIGINNRDGALLAVRYAVQPLPGSNTPSGTIRRIVASPCGIVSSTPPNIAGTTSGMLSFDGSCTQRSPQQLIIEASSANADGQVCVQLIALVAGKNGRPFECTRTICFRCTPVAESRCDELTVTPSLSVNARQSVRLFNIHNEKAPASPICGVEIALSPAVHGLSGGALVIDGVAHSWPAATSGNYTMIGSQHGMPAAHDVQFALGVDFLNGWTGTVTITTRHCDGRTCTMTYRWTPLSPREIGLTRSPGASDDLCITRIAFDRTRPLWAQVRTIGLRLREPATRIVALTPATTPCEPGVANCDDLFEHVIVSGPLATMTLRAHASAPGDSGRNGGPNGGGYGGRDSVGGGRDTLNGGDTVIAGGDAAEIMLMCKSPGGMRATAEIVYFDADGRELGSDVVQLCGDWTTTVRLPGATTGSSTVRVWPNPVTAYFTVGFTVRERGNVRLDVYDLLGRQVMQFDAGMMETGEHDVTLDAAHLPTGTYFVRVAGGRADGTEKVELGR